ncbi:hypothetical protein GCM10022419_103980 [Nonomuraea rosea]|uniref:Uncharacterized protein n=1 Tax=Nonomuraea rosea TaxID=638574 RepID=A0ABP6ZAQ1_9ACTN
MRGGAGKEHADRTVRDPAQGASDPGRAEALLDQAGLIRDQHAAAEAAHVIAYGVGAPAVGFRDKRFNTSTAILPAPWVWKKLRASPLTTMRTPLHASGALTHQEDA